MRRRGFTIIELLMVIAIISVLITITISAIAGSMKRARAQKAEAIRTLVEQGVATYYAQEDKWPLEKLNGDTITPNAGAGGDKNASNKVAYRLDDSEVQEVIKNLVKKTQEGSPVMDVSGLFVARRDGGSDEKKAGMDFTSAVRGTKRNPEGIRLSNMLFGYPDAESGKFRHLKMVYSIETDKLSVSR